MNMQTPRTEFAQALKAIATERGLDPDVILDTIKQAIIAAYKRDAKERGEETEGYEYEVALDSINGETSIFAWGPFSEEATDEEKQAGRKDKKNVTPPGFGRIAAQTAKQVIHQKIREAEKGAILTEYEEKIGSLVSGLILRFDGPNVRVDLGKTEGIMDVSERIPNERLNLNQRLSFLLKDIKETPRGRDLFLSRSDPEFIKNLFAREVPEVSSGSVEIKAIAREAGTRTKIAVFSSQSGVDPVGSCVGQKGVRVQAVTNEIGGERVDVIPYSEDVAELIKLSLAPAQDLTVTLDEETKTAKVLAPEDQLSLAIGKDGQNVRLTAKLTGWRIEVESNGVVKNEEAAAVEEKPNETIEEKVVESVEAPTEDVKEEVEKQASEETSDVSETNEPMEVVETTLPEETSTLENTSEEASSEDSNEKSE